ncbi:MAG: COX15/CtaA family protein [Myxococcaceae bacterium]
MPSPRAFQRFSIGVVLYTLAVIAWGGYVRASGSGAGCGSHWPDCNGEIVPRAASVQTAIEYSHRVSSGVSLILVVALAIWAFVAHARGHAVRRSAVASVVFILLEAAIGAGLVLWELVGLDASLFRPVAMCLHLINTFLLLSALGAVAFHARYGDGQKRGETTVARLLRSSHFALAFVGASGSIAALGETLTQLGVRASLVELLVRLRISHPVVAVAATLFCLFAVSVAWREQPPARPAAGAFLGALFAQLLVGIFNVAFKAPIALQLLHLLCADLVWLALVFTTRFAVWTEEKSVHVAASRVNADAAIASSVQP